MEASQAASDVWACGIERVGAQAVADWLGVSRARVRNWANSHDPANVTLASVLAAPREVAIDTLEAALLVAEGALVASPPGDREGPTLAAVLAVVRSACELLPWVERLAARPLSSLTDDALSQLRDLLRGLGRRLSGALAHIEEEITRRRQR